MDMVAEELERRSRYLSSLIRQQRKRDEQPPPPPTSTKPKPNPEEALKLLVEKELEAEERRRKEEESDGKWDQQERRNLRIRASDMPPELQKHAFSCAKEVLASMTKLDNKRLALTLKKEFDTSYGPAWHCIVGTSFGSYVTHSMGGFLYFSIDKVHILLFRTAVETLDQ